MAKPTWLTLSLAGLMLLASIFAALAMVTAWAHDGEARGRATAFGFDGVSAVTDANTITNRLGNDALDDHDGIGLARTGVVLARVAAGLFVAAILLFENQWLADHAWLGIAGVGAAAAGAVMWLVAVILFPIGVAGLAESAFGSFAQPDLNWGPGLVFGILASVCSLATLALAGVHRAVTSGFRFELAETQRVANFD